MFWVLSACEGDGRPTLGVTRRFCTPAFAGAELSVVDSEPTVLRLVSTPKRGRSDLW